MSWKRSASNILFSLGLLLMLTACEVPEIGFGPAAGAPLSTFVPPRQSIQVKVDQPFALESYHLSRNKLGTLEIFVDGQPISTEQTGDQPVFPGGLATVQVVEWPVRNDSGPLILPASTCRAVLDHSERREMPALALNFPSSTWSVCHVWIGHVPGSYDLTVVATDRAGHQGEPITQRIEVK